MAPAFQEIRILSTELPELPQFWLGLQMDYELDLAQDRLADRLTRELKTFRKVA